ncbi:MAG: glycosyltransferase family 4 protein, partial [Candidatus Hodarchaeales archaeon]
TLKKICHISSSSFSPFPRGLKEIKTVYDSHKYHVEVVSFDKDGKLPKIQYVHNVKIIRKKPIYWFKGQARIFNVFFFWISLFPESLRQKAEIYHCSGYLSLLIGIPLKILTGNKVVYDAYEDWVYQVKRRHSILPALVQVIEQKLVKYVDYILTVDSVNNELYVRFKKLNDNVIVLQNAPSIKDFDIKARKKVGFKGGFEHKVVIYVGGISKDKGIFKMLEAIKEVKEDVPNVKLVIAGLLSDVVRHSVTQFIHINKLEENVEFLGYMDYEKVPSLLKASTIGLILYQPTSWHLRSKASSKLFLYMTASIPVIVSDFPGFREIVDKANCGVLVNSSDVHEISKSITNLLTDTKLAQQLGKNGRKAVIKGYNWEKEERKLMGVYELM